MSDTNNSALTPEKIVAVMHVAENHLRKHKTEQVDIQSQDVPVMLSIDKNKDRLTVQLYDIDKDIALTIERSSNGFTHLKSGELDPKFFKVQDSCFTYHAQVSEYIHEDAQSSGTGEREIAINSVEQAKVTDNIIDRLDFMSKQIQMSPIRINSLMPTSETIKLVSDIKNLADVFPEPCQHFQEIEMPQNNQLELLVSKYERDSNITLYSAFIEPIDGVEEPDGVYGQIQFDYNKETKEFTNIAVVDCPYYQALFVSRVVEESTANLQPKPLATELNIETSLNTETIEQPPELAVESAKTTIQPQVLTAPQKTARSSKNMEMA